MGRRIVPIRLLNLRSVQLIVLSLRWVLVDLCGHMTDGKTQFLPSGRCHWFFSYCAKKRIKVWTQIHGNSGSYFLGTWVLTKFGALNLLKFNMKYTKKIKHKYLWKEPMDWNINDCYVFYYFWGGSSFTVCWFDVIPFCTGIHHSARVLFSYVLRLLFRW